MLTVLTWNLSVSRPTVGGPTVNQTPTTLVCPKCQGAMNSYERNGVVIDQCQECRGIFLDRGELERLMDAEDKAYGTLPPPPSPPRFRDDYREEPRYGGGHGGGSKHGQRRRSGLLGQLFD